MVPSVDLQRTGAAWVWRASYAALTLLVLGAFFAVTWVHRDHEQRNTQQATETGALLQFTGDCEELLNNIRSVREPANNVLISQQPTTERKRLAATAAKLRERLQVVRRKVEQLGDEAARAEAGDRLNSAEDAVARLVEHAHTVLTAAEVERPLDALPALTAVNRESSIAGRLVGDVVKLSLRLQREQLQSSARADAGNHRTVQWGLGVFAIFSLFAVWYGVYATTREHESRRQADDAQARLKQLIDVSPAGVLVVDRQGVVQLANPALAAAFGYSQDELKGQPLDRLLPSEQVAPHRELVASFFRRPALREMSAERQVWGLHREGRKIPLEIRLAPIATDQGPAVMALVSDISQRHALAQQLQRQAELLQMLTAAQERFITRRDAHSFFDESLRELFRLTGSQFGYIAELVDNPYSAPALKVLALVGDLGPAAEQFGSPSPEAPLEMLGLDHLYGAAAAARRPVIANDPADDPRQGDSPLAAAPLTSLLALPLIRGGEVIGVIGVANRAGGYDQVLARELEPVAATFAALIESWRRDQERKQVEEALRFSVEEVENARERLQRHSLALQEKNDQLEAEQHKAQSASQAKSEFLANMSHEIRTPMTAILGYADMLLEGASAQQLTPQQVESLRTIHRNGEHLLGLINDILDLSKIEAGKMEVEHIECQPLQILTDVEKLMRIRADAKGLPLSVAHESRLPQRIESDPTRLRQILVNLVGNALKFTEVGGVTLACRLVQGEQPRIEFDVIDSGIGMTEEQIERLFRPFTQADTSMARKFGGTGLGLTISKRLAQMLGGDIAIVRSEIGKGTTFRLTVNVAPGDCLSLVSAHGPKSPVELAAPAGAPLPTLPPCRILLAEDGPDNQRLISFVLKKAGADVTVVENGAIACERILKADSAGQPFDVVLMDMAMPVLDGYQAVAQLRAADYSGPIIALTAHAMAGDREKCLAVGCSGYSAKPIDRAQLLGAIREALAANPSASAPQASEGQAVESPPSLCTAP